MKLSLCTISFRHHLSSIADLAQWARACHFDSLELWGIHARNLMTQSDYNREWLADHGLTVSMLSDYLPLLANRQDLTAKVELLCQLANHWGTQKLRTFAGDQGSAEVDAETRQRMVTSLQHIAGICAQAGINLVIETHPVSLADNLASTSQLFDEVACDNVKLNFDVLHVWESGVDPNAAFDLLHQYVVHLHLKNIHSAEQLSVFAPANVYSPAGERLGMVSVFDGVVDYRQFLDHLRHNHPHHYQTLDASLEWFGNDCWRTLNDDRYQLQQLMTSAAPCLLAK